MVSKDHLAVYMVMTGGWMGWSLVNPHEIYHHPWVVNPHPIPSHPFIRKTPPNGNHGFSSGFSTEKRDHEMVVFSFLKGWDYSSPGSAKSPSLQPQRPPPPARQPSPQRQLLGQKHGRGGCFSSPSGESSIPGEMSNLRRWVPFSKQKYRRSDMSDSISPCITMIVSHQFKRWF